MVVGGQNGLPRSFVLIDLGIARTWREGAEADTTRLGTRNYAPPEQFGFGQTSVRSDVYALGAVLWFCLTGEDPAPGMDSRQLAERPDVPSDLRRVVAKAMSFDPEARYASAEELARAVEGRAGSGHFSPAGAVGVEVPAAAGRAWNVVLVLAVAVLVAASWVNVAEPAGSGAAWPLWLRLLAFGAWMPAGFASVAFVLADRRRLRHRVGLLQALVLCAAVVLGGLLAIGVLGALFLRG